MNTFRRTLLPGDTHNKTFRLGPDVTVLRTSGMNHEATEIEAAYYTHAAETSQGVGIPWPELPPNPGSSTELVQMVEVLSLLAAVVGVVTAYLLASGPMRRRNAVRRAIARTPGDTPELREAARLLRDRLRPSVTSLDYLVLSIEDAMGSSAERRLTETFLTKLHEEFNERDMEVLWSPPDVRQRSRPLPARREPEMHLVGRKQDFLALNRLIDSGRSCVISGPPGIGKTRLLEAVMVATARPTAFARLEQGGHPMRDARLGLQRYCPGAFPIDDDEGLAMLQRALPDNLVFFIDNADEESSIDAVGRLSAHLPELCIVVTSRGGRFDGFTPLYLEPLNDDDARELVRLTGFNGDPEAIEEAIAAGTGNPLLVRQAAWTSSGPLGHTTASDRVASLMRNVRDAAPDLVLTIGQLPSAYHPMPCIAAIPGAADIYGRLAGNAVMRDLDGTALFHETFIRAARESSALAPPNKKERALHNILISYAAWIDTKPSHETIDLILPNLLELTSATSEVNKLTALHLIATLCGDNYDDPNGYFASGGIGTVLLEHTARLRSIAMSVRGPEAAIVLKNLGIFGYFIDDPRTEALLYNARSMYEECGDQDGMAACSWMLGAVADDGSRYGDAERLYRQPLEWLSKPRPRAISHHMIGCNLYHQGRFQEAREEFARAESLAGNDPQIRSRLDRRLAYLELVDGNQQNALTMLHRARESARELERPRNVARISRHIAEALLALGNVGAADHEFQVAYDLFADMGDKRGLGGTLRGMARVLLVRGEHALATEFLNQSRELALGRMNQDLGHSPRSVFGFAAAEEELARVAHARCAANEVVGDHLRSAANAYEAIGRVERVLALTSDFGFSRNAQQPPVKAVVFDLIDTLAIRDRSCWDDVDAELASDLDVDLDTFRDAWRRSRDRSSVDASWSTEMRLEWVAQEVGRRLDGRSVKHHAQLQRSLWRDAVHLHGPVLGSFEALTRTGRRVAILTNGSVAMSGIFDHLGLSEFGPGLLSCETGIVKPYSGSYQAALSALKCRASEAVYVGNGDDHELEGARQLGMFTVRLGSQKPRQYKAGQSFRWHAQHGTLTEFVDGILE